jgi:hypothetical protein
MNSDYVYLCGVMWCNYGQQEAGKELMRAAHCEDPDLSTLALAMLQEGFKSFQKFRRVELLGPLPVCV